MTSPRWWHGGPRINGDWILPADQIPGCVTTRDAFTTKTAVDDVYDPTKVYIVNDRQAALMFAAVWPTPWLYMVEPDGPLEADPDFIGNPADPLTAMRCPRARILRRLKPSNADVDLARAALRMMNTGAAR
jgi:hypothetical protein